MNNPWSVQDIKAFRNSFPEFQDTKKYPSEMITFWSNVALAQVNQCVWKNQWPTGVQLYTAHEIVLAAQNQKLGIAGGVPGTGGGVPNTKTVGGVTVGYDSQTTSEKDAGYWNLTNYGKQFMRLAKLFGAGALQLTGGFFAPNLNSWWNR
jgi:hypothetical protein